MADKVCEELWSKLKIDGSKPESQDPDLKIESFQLNPHLAGELGEHEEEDNEDEEDFKFSFPLGNPTRSPISDKDAFQNGQIRPTFPVFENSLILDDEAPSQPAAREPMKVFTTEEVDGTTEEIKSAGLGQKSNSTGSSRVWRFRDLVHRSSSDGKDALRRDGDRDRGGWLAGGCWLLGRGIRTRV